MYAPLSASSRPTSRSRPSYFLLINACVEIGCGGLDGLGEGEVLGRAGVADGFPDLPKLAGLLNRVS